MPEVVGKAGILVPPADSDSLAREIIFLLNHPEQREKMAKAGIERVEAIFNWTSAAKEMVEIYREAIDGYRRSA